MSGNLAVVLTNLFLIPTTSWAFKRGHIYIATNLFLTMLSSLFYHACYNLNTCILLVPRTWQILDFTFSLNNIPALAVYIAGIENPNVRIVIEHMGMAGCFINVLEGGEYSLYWVGIGGSVVVLFKFLMDWRLPKFDWPDMTIGCSLLIAGLVCQEYANRPGYDYGLLHSFWHVCTQLAPIFLIEMRQSPVFSSFKRFWTDIVQPAWRWCFGWRATTAIEPPQSAAELVNVTITSLVN